MTSKNSFLDSMRENLKRRKGIIVVLTVIFLLVYPVAMSLLMMDASGQKEYMPLEQWTQMMSAAVTTYLGVNVGMVIIATLVAVIIAMQGFSYLFHRVKIDLYMSVPIAKRRRFGVIYLNGVLIYAVPLLLSFIISLLIAAGNGLVTVEMIKSIVYAFLSGLIFYLSVYSITIIAIMLTGNMLISLCATAVILFYEMMVRGVLSTLSSAFFSSYYMDGSVDNLFNAVTSPFTPYVGAVNGLQSQQSQQVAYLLEKTGLPLLKVLLIAVIASAIAYFLYSIRPAESCNKAIAFPKTKPVIKVLVMVPISLLSGLLFFGCANGNVPMTILGIVLGVILSHGILEVIFEFDIKAIVKHLASAGVGAVCTFIVFGIFFFDVTGFDSWIPDPDKVESVGFYVPSFYSSDVYDFTSQNGRWISTNRYCLENVKLTDTQSFCSMMKEVLEESAEENKDRKTIYAQVAYNMKNGDVKYRQVNIDYNEHMEELNVLLTSQEYLEGTFQYYKEEFENDAEITAMQSSNGIEVEGLPENDMKEIYENYKKDLKFLDMRVRAEELPVAVLTMDVSSKQTQGGKYRNACYYELPVYASFKNTIDYLDKLGYSTDWREKADDITAITLSYYDELDNWVEEKYDDAATIEQIKPALIPSELMSYGLNRYYINAYAYVEFFRYEETANGSEYSGFNLNLDSEKLPKFLKEKLAGIMP